jgi:hypothetical protein
MSLNQETFSGQAASRVLHGMLGRASARYPEPERLEPVKIDTSEYELRLRILEEKIFPD